MNSYWTKRIFDIIVSVLVLLILSPLFLIGSILAKIQSSGPVFYKAKRVGIGGSIFKMYKFRTMVVDADKIGIGLTTHKDPRVTPIGRFLRHTKLDELPNFINVLRGNMSLIGPRPESPYYVQYYTETQKQVLLAKPGITGPSQIANRNEEEKLSSQTDPENYYIKELMPKKLAIDLQYVATQCFLSDMRWLLKTLWVVMLPTKRNIPTNEAGDPHKV
ncbi:MAG: sugar transferase [Candidatus Poribacteria bacterium]|nr:sugar transferase [Candidatus Poribacteria bacterium]